MGRPTSVRIDTAALQHNLRKTKALAPNSKTLAMVKADAYGHGLVCVAKALKEADAFGVACLEEAVILRKAGIKTPIVLIEGFFKGEELSLISQLDLELVIHQWEQLEILE